MKKAYIHAAGVCALGLLAVATLPSASRRVESRLQTELDTALEGKGLSGIEARFDGQTVDLGYGDDAIKVVHVDDPGALGPRMAWAVDTARDMEGGLYKGGRSGKLWGPVTRITVNQPSIDGLSEQMNAQLRARAAAVAQAHACTDDVTQAVASRKLSFVSGSFELTPDSGKILDDVYAAIHACPGRLVLQVDGFTDDVGEDKANVVLSSARADAAAKGLITRGLETGMVRSAGHGESEPVADNTTPEGQAANRRVTFTMSVAPESPPESPPGVTP